MPRLGSGGGRLSELCFGGFAEAGEPNAGVGGVDDAVAPVGRQKGVIAGIENHAAAGVIG